MLPALAAAPLDNAASAANPTTDYRTRYSSAAVDAGTGDAIPTPIVPYASTLYAPSRPELASPTTRPVDPPPASMPTPSTVATPIEVVTPAPQQLQAPQEPQVIDAGQLVPVYLPPAVSTVEAPLTPVVPARSEKPASDEAKPAKTTGAKKSPPKKSTAVDGRQAKVRENGESTLRPISERRETPQPAEKKIVAPPKGFALPQPAIPLNEAALRKWMSRLAERIID